MDYIEVIVKSSVPDALEILTAAFAEIEFESFDVEGNTLKAYIPEANFDKKILDETCAHYQGLFSFEYSIRKVPYQNWNAIWESNFQPITVGSKLRVRAVFHNNDPSYPLEIVIQPKMSFGTGHHATTWLVMNTMLDINFSGKKILDFGTGTGILAVLSNKLGASNVWAVDNDPQCTENALENFQLNHCEEIMLATGDIHAFDGNIYDIIIGNITRNVIVEFLEDISLKLQTSGLFIASGFYEEDLSILQNKAREFNLQFINSNRKDKWCMSVFQKI
jgi:ribosomal protein L11 methyltransferase